MHIRRDRSHLHFGRQQRGPSSRLITLLAITLIAAGLVLWQMDRIEQEVAVLLGDPPTPTASAAAIASDAYIDYINGNLDSAERKYAAALRLEPTNADVLYEYAHVQMLLNKGEEGLDSAERLIDLAPNDPRGHALRLLGLYQANRLDEAISDGLGVMDRFPDYALTYAYLAWSYADIGRWMQAVDMGERAVTLDPDSVDAYRAYAYALTWIGAREEAAQALERAIELHPTLDFLYFEAAEKYRALENVPAAIQAYERVLAIKPTNTRALLRLCQTYLYMREDARAEEYCTQALDIDPNYAAVWQQLGQVYYAESKFQESIDAYEKCVELEFDSIYCYYQRGLAHAYLDQCDQAVPLLQESMIRTESDRILGHVREGLRMCDQDPNLYETLPTLEGEEADADS